MDAHTYPERESKSLEFKVRVQKFDALIKTAVAFANGVGGKIIIGIEDKSRKIIGVDADTRERVYDDFPNSLYDSTSPHLIPQIYEQRIDDNVVMIIEIPPVYRKPCFLRSEGLPKGVYIRIGSSTRRANEMHVEELMRESQRVSYDEEAIHADVNILSEKNLSSHYEKYKREILLEDKIITRGVANHDTFFPTVAGVLLFSDSPDSFIPEAHIMCTRFSGNEGRNIIQTEEIQGPINKQIDVAYNLVLSWLKRNYELVGARLLPKTLIPEVALREAIVNAVIHRKYSIPGASKIAVYENHLEIFSPGNFPGHVNINNLGEGITHFRNPILGRMAHKMGIIEKLGSGLKLIFDSCKNAGIATPTFLEDGDYVKVIFEFTPERDNRKSNEESLVELFNSAQTLTIHEMVEYLGRSKNTTFKALHKLIDDGVVKQVGKGRATRYIKTSRN